MSATIRQARQGDFEYVARLMEQALDPYYDGDHRAHAERIFNAHMGGGDDPLGHFSRSQHMWILDGENGPAGLVHLVAKKQGTFKISPLIVDLDIRGKHGYGSMLLQTVEDFAKQNGARQIYCTVAEQNRSALQFFLKKDYVVAGKSDSHYKEGVTETILYKLFIDQTTEIRFDEPNLSVLPMEDRHKPQVRKLCLEQLPQHFATVNEEWVDALFAGFDRRHTQDVHTKFKLMYIVSDRAENILGVAAATPKKGEPIKLMPCIAVNPQAFVALLSDVPQHLRDYGHKIYTHIVPNVEETFILERLGWTNDAMMPGAYHDDHVTQQWSLDLGETYMRTMRMKQQFLDAIMSGKKDLEVRVGYNNIRQIRPGERIRIMSHTEDEVIRVNGLRIYKSIDAMLDSEDSERIIPGKGRREAIKKLRQIYPPHKEKLGVYVFEVAPEKK